MSDGRAGRARAAPAPVRVAALVLVAHALWLTWVEVQALRSPLMTWTHVLLRAAWILVLWVLARGLWRGSARARTWTIVALASMLAVYLVIAAIVRHVDAERWDPAAWFGPAAIAPAAWNIVPLVLLLLSSRGDGRST
ncbi:MAG TPA: hypothetical protein VFY71_09840 [Planctomycetota bacterium]|nr:hypothetical protein [Planctomycetota bacterium]